jgi:hypothetical protein
MTTALRISCLFALLTMPCFVMPLSGKDLPTLACSPDRPVVPQGASIMLRVWTSADRPQDLTYDWEISGGKSRGSGAEITWDFNGLQPGTYTATVHVAYPTGETNSCAVQVLVEPTEAKGGVTGWSLLLSGTKEKSGYGLYSYILFGSRPTDATRERYLKTLEAYAALVESIVSLEASGVARHQLNITYLPVTKLPPPKDKPSTEWLLEHYDYARARALLSVLPGAYRSDGPYIVSRLNPIKASEPIVGKYLYQDLSTTAPRVIAGYAREFFNQAAQERYWEERTAQQLALKLQNTMYLMATALPVVAGAMTDIKKIKSEISWAD